MNKRLIITIDGIEVVPEQLAERFEDYLVREGLSPLVALGTKKELVSFLEGYEDKKPEIL